MKEKVKLLIPFDKKGNQVTYYTNWDLQHDRIVTKENYEFTTTLQYNGFSRGRSALNISWRDEKGKTYESGMALLNMALTEGVLENFQTEIHFGRFTLSGTFTFKKQGTSVLLTLVK